MEGSHSGAVGRSGGGRPTGGGQVESAGDEQDEPSSSPSVALLTMPEEPSGDQQSQQPTLEDDLEQFRRKWRQEVSQQEQQLSSSTAASETTGQQTAADTTTKLDKAVELYMAGMQLEQRGLLYEAIQKYRRAVQTDPTVEETVRQLLLTRHQQQRSAATPAAAALDDNGNASSPAPRTPEEEEEEEEAGEDALSRLHQLTLEDGRCCRPDVPQTAVHISNLPAEVIQLIFCWVVSSDVDVRSLDLLALVCRGFYRIARDNAIWKRICHRVLGPGCAGSEVPAVWRELYLSRPHLHFSGCYISRASYIRCGELTGYQDQNYRPWHMVRYYRLLRFFPEGQLLMLTSADDPAVSVGHLLHRLPRTGPVVPGHFRLKGDRVVAVLSVPREASRRIKSSRARLRRGNMLDYDPGEQMLHIELELAPFRLVWHSYKVVTMYRNGNEASHTISLNDQYPAMVFSRVRSYTAASEAPLP